MSATSQIKLEILSPEKVLFRGTADAVGLPGKEGYMTVLPGHAAMIAELDVGALVVNPGAGEQKYFIAGGFVEVRSQGVRVLVDVIEKPADINAERARQAEKRAQERLSGKSGDKDIDYTRANIALRRAQARISLAILAR